MVIVNVHRTVKSFLCLLISVVKCDFMIVWFQTPLHYATDNGHLEVVKSLVLSGADTSAPEDVRSYLMKSFPEFVIEDSWMLLCVWHLLLYFGLDIEYLGRRMYLSICVFMILLRCDDDDVMMMIFYWKLFYFCNSMIWCWLCRM